MARKSLDFADSVGGTYSVLGENLGSFLMLFAGWVALVAAAGFGMPIVLGWLLELFPAIGELLAALPYYVLMFLPVLPFAIASIVATISIVIAWHRRIIKGVVPDSPYPTSFNAIMGYLWRVVIVFGIPLVPLFAVTMALAYALGGEAQSGGRLAFAFLVFIASVAAMLVAGRFGLVLPAWAVGDRTMTFERAWRLTDGNTWLLFWGGVISVLPFSLVQTVCEWILERQPITEDLTSTVLALTFIGALAEMLGYVTAAGFYSFVYLQLGAPEGDHITQAPPALER